MRGGNRGGSAGLAALAITDHDTVSALAIARPEAARWADEFHLVPIAGSDFHAPDRPGRWVGSITTPPADLDARCVGPDQRIHLRTAWLSR